MLTQKRTNFFIPLFNKYLVSSLGAFWNWVPTQKRTIFFILLFKKYLVSSLGASGARFLELGAHSEAHDVLHTSL